MMIILNCDCNNILWLGLHYFFALEAPKKKSSKLCTVWFPPSYRQSHHHHYRSPSCERVLDGFKIQGLHPWQSMDVTLKLTPWPLDMVSIPEFWGSVFVWTPQNNSWGLAFSWFPNIKHRSSQGMTEGFWTSRGWTGISSSESCGNLHPELFGSWQMVKKSTKNVGNHPSTP